MPTLEEQAERMSLEDHIRVTNWINLRNDIEAKRFIIIQLPEWIARIRRMPLEKKFAFLGGFLIGSAIVGYFTIIAIWLMETG